MNVDFICKLCHLPGSCELNPEEEKILAELDEANRSRIETLVPALCHHNCWDIWWTCMQSEKQLNQAASILAADETGHVRELITNKIAKIVNRWVLNEYRRFKAQAKQISQQRMVESILNAPLATPRILRDTRNIIGSNKQQILQ